VNARHALNRADAATLQEQPEAHLRFLEIEGHLVERLFLGLRERAVALGAAVALIPLAVLPVAGTTNGA
jgi:hypothetical protein